VYAHRATQLNECSVFVLDHASNRTLFVAKHAALFVAKHAALFVAKHAALFVAKHAACWRRLRVSANSVLVVNVIDVWWLCPQKGMRKWGRPCRVLATACLLVDTTRCLMPAFGFG
jgi:hypothetical protein